MKLTASQKDEMYRDGYVKITNAVSQELVDRALRAINHSLGEGIPPEEVPIYRARSYCPEIQASEPIVDLFERSNVKGLVGSVVDLERIEPIRAGQIALRFPEAGQQPQPQPARPHIDGMYSPTNGVRKGQINNFTALVGVLLSELPGANAGNFTVWPGTHLAHERYFQAHGAASLLEGMPPVVMPEPVQITGRPGDVVLAHYTLAHGVTPNVSPHVRYAIFFRLKHVDITPDNWPQSMEDIWLHWPGMRETVERHEAGKQLI